MVAKLAASGLAIWGIAYEDDPDKLAQFLAQNGNPYQRLAADADWRPHNNGGVYGVPETYFIDKTGIVRWRYAGALTDDVVASALNPLLARYSSGSSGSPWRCCPPWPWRRTW